MLHGRRESDLHNSVSFLVKARGGFTIVELLIAIIIVGILATLTLVAYTNIQVQAYNTRTIAGSSEYRKAISGYVLKNGDYPYFDRTVGGVCLGIGYKDFTNDSIGDCGEQNYYLSENNQFNTNLRTYVSSMPAASTRVVNMPYQADKWTGVVLHYYAPYPPGSSAATPQTKDGFTVDGTSQPYYMMYVLEGGKQKCGLTVVVPDDAQSGWPRMKTDTTRQGYSWTDDKTTACVVSMPSPI